MLNFLKILGWHGKYPSQAAFDKAFFEHLLIFIISVIIVIFIFIENLYLNKKYFKKFYSRNLLLYFSLFLAYSIFFYAEISSEQVAYGLESIGLINAPLALIWLIGVYIYMKIRKKITNTQPFADPIPMSPDAEPTKDFDKYEKSENKEITKAEQ